MPEKSVRTTSDSRCTQPATIPWSVHKAVGSGFSVHSEVSDAVNSVEPNAYKAAEVMGRVWATLRLASVGELLTGMAEDEDFEPVRTQPALWELKWNLKRRKKDTVYMRLYHAEPPSANPGILVLRAHVKDGQTDQDAEMAVAAQRYIDDECAADHWGHVSPDCPHCLL